MNYHVEAKEAVDPIIDGAVRRGDKRRLGQIFLILGSYYFVVKEDYIEAVSFLEKGLKAAADTQDPITYILGGYFLGVTHGWSCEVEKSVKLLQQAIDLNMATNNIWGTAAIKSMLAVCYSYFWGKCDLGFRLSKEAIQLAEESGENYSRGMADGAHGFSFFAKGYLDDAEEYLLKSMEFCEKIRFPAWDGAAKFALADLYFEKRDFIKATAYFEKTSQGLEDARIIPSISNLAKIGLLRCKVADDERSINLETLFSYAINNRLKISEGFSRRWIGEILGQLDGTYLSEAESWINQAIEADRKNGMNFFLGRDYSSYANLLIRKGDRQKARENLGKAIETFQECGADGWVEKGERKLGEIA